MPTALQYLETAKPKRHRVYVILGEDPALRVDALDRVVRVVAPQERVTFHVGDGEATPARIWDAVTTRPLPGVTSRLVVVHSADRLRSWASLKDFIDGASVFSETVLVLLLDRPQLGRRQRSRTKSLPGAPVWETVLDEWEQWLDAYSGAVVIRCSPLSLDSDRGKPSAVARWLSLRLPVTQRQAEYVWRRVGGASLLARDALRALRAIGIADATGLPQLSFARAVDQVIGLHGAEDLVDQLLFNRRAEALASVQHQEFSRVDWHKILSLLAQRLDWLGPLHVALATNEQLDQVMRRLGIHRKWILYYAHREDPSHNVARFYDAKRVARCRCLIADMDSALGQSKGVPEGFGEALVSSW